MLRLKDKTDFNVELVDGYHAQNSASSVPVLDASGKLPIAQIPTGTTATTVSLGNHGHSNYVYGTGASAVTTVSNANTIWKSGFYEGNNGTNYPTTSGWYWLIHAGHTANNNGGAYNYGLQIAGANITSDFYMRTTNANGSGTWRKLYHDGNKPTSADVGALPTAGGTMTGNITFTDVTSTTYPANSNMIKWNGGTDGADIYYRLTAADTGQLVFNLRDDANTTFGFALSGTVKATIDTSGNYSGNAATATTWKTARTFTIGNTGKSVNGSANVSWSLAEIGAVSATDTSVVRGARKSWTSITGGTEGTDPWITLFTIGDSTNTPILALVKAYAHSSLLFSVSIGYDTSTVITILNANTNSVNDSYRYIKGVRVLAGGLVQVKFHHKGTANISCQIIGSSENVSLSETLTVYTGSNAVKASVDSISNATMYITTGTTPRKVITSAGGTIDGGGLTISGGDLTVSKSGSKIVGNKFESSLTTGTHIAGSQGTAIINSTAAGNNYTMLARMKSTNGVWTLGNWSTSFNLFYTADSTITAGSNTYTKRLTLLDESGNSSFPGTLTTGGAITSGGVITVPQTATGYSSSQPTQIGYGYLGSYGHLRLLANTDDSSGSNNEYVHLAAARGTAPSTDYGVVVYGTYANIFGNRIAHSAVSTASIQSTTVWRNIFSVPASEGSFILQISRNYNSPNSEAYTFLIHYAYQKANITQLGAQANGKLLEQIRVIGDSNTTIRVECFIKNNPNYANKWVASLHAISLVNSIPDVKKITANNFGETPGTGTVYGSLTSIEATGMNMTLPIKCSGLTSNGNVTLSSGNLVLSANNASIGGICGGGTDTWNILGGGTNDNGYLEINTRDNGNEPIYVRQYNSSGLVRTATILDGSGNTSFPGTVTVAGFNSSSANFGSTTVTRTGSTNAAAIKFANTNGTLGFIGMTGNANGGLMRWTADTSTTTSGTVYTILDTGNYTNYVEAKGHTHKNIVSSGNLTNVTGATTLTAAGVPGGVSMYQVYNNGYPVTYGNVLNLNGSSHGAGQILLEWSGSATASAGAHGRMYIRSKRDVADTLWSDWAQVYTTAHKPTTGDLGALPTAGGTMTGNITFKEISGTSYPVNSSKIVWNGGTDGADIYYRLTAADRGQLVFNLRDDTDTTFGFAYAGTVKSTIDTNGNFSGRAGSAVQLATARNINRVSFNGTSDVVVPMNYRICNIGDNNTNLYHLILESGKVTGSWVDEVITIVITQQFNSESFGIAKINLRTNDAANGATSSGAIQWLVRSGFEVDALQFNIVNTGGNTYMDVFYKSPGAYASLVWYVLGEGGRANFTSAAWTKNDTNASGTKAYTLAAMQALRSYTSKNVSAYDSGIVNALTTQRYDGSSHNANFDPGKNKTVIREYSSNATNVPTAHYYHILSSQGPDTNYTTQLALGMTNKAVYYRQKSSNSWQSWNRLAFASEIIPISGTSDYTITGNLLFANSGTAFRGLQGKCGDNDYWRIGGAGTGSNAGYMEIATADDGNEPIYVRQYTGVYATLTRTATLLDGSGNTSFPVKVTSPIFEGTLHSIDTRSTNAAPSTYIAGLKPEFKTASTVGINNSGGTYVGTLTFRQYSTASDWSGGKATQLAVTDNNNLYMRKGDGNGWASWRIVNATQQWTANITCARWSRLFQFTGGSTVGGSFIVNIRATRNSVVYNPTLMVNYSHSTKANIVQINNTTYSNIQVRAVVDGNGAGYFEMYDNVNSATTSTTQSVTVSVTVLNGDTLITQYTSNTSGATVPSGYTAVGTLTTVSGTYYTGVAAKADRWNTDRTLTVGNTGKTVNGTANVSWSTAEILGNSKTLDKTTDWNTANVTGIYEASGFNDSGATGANRPSSAYGWGGLLVLRHKNVTNQIYLSHGSNQMWIRGGWNGSWNASWTRVYTTDYKPTPADIGALSTAGGTMTGAITTPNNAQGIKIGDDAVICDRNIGNHIVIEGSTATAGGITFGSGKDTNIYRGDANRLQTDDTFRASGEIQSTSANTFRAVQGNYGFFLRNDGSDVYFMLTNSGSPYGSYSTLRPLYINCSSGRVSMGNGLSVSNGVTVGGGLTVSPVAYNSAYTKASTFTDTAVQRSMIYFTAASGSNDPGAIYLETSPTSADTNKGVLHLCPSDDASNDGTDYVSIHGTNDAENIKLHTGGNANFAGTVTASSFSGKATSAGSADQAARWTTARTFTIGNKGKSVNGTANVSWSLSEIGAAPASHSHNYLDTKGTNTIASSGDTTSAWGAHGNSVHWYTDAGTLTDKPGSWGYILNIGSGSEVHQIWMTQSSGNLAHRGGNSSGWNGSWRTVLDSSNYGSYCTPNNIGALGAYWENNYWGMALPDRSNRSDWIRTTQSGIIPYASGGSSSLGTSSWPFTSVYSQTVYGNNPGGSWISGKTLSNAAFSCSTQQSSGSYHPILAVKTSSSNVLNIGGLGDQVGWYGYKSGRTDNGYDYCMTIQGSNGNVWFSGCNDIQHHRYSGNTYFTTKRTDTGVECRFGIGEGGTNHGVYSSKQGRWLIYGDAYNVYLPAGTKIGSYRLTISANAPGSPSTGDIWFDI